MEISRSRLLTSGAVLAAMLPLLGCSVEVRDGQSSKNADVDVSTPVGDISVRSIVDLAATGLRVYPGARPLDDVDESGEPRDVTVGTAGVSVKVIAAKFRSSDAPDRILDFYRREMRPFGSVSECQGDIDFKDVRGSNRAVCKRDTASEDIQLAAGTEDRQRIVSVKPRGSGTEFSLVYVRTRNQS